MAAMIGKVKSNFKNFWGVIKDTVQQMRDGELALVASSLSFSTILGMVPFLAVVTATFQSIGGFEALYPKVEFFLLMNLREAAGSDLTKYLRIFLKNINAGKVGTTGAVFLFITSLRLLHDMEVGIHRVWNQKNTRPFYKRLIYQWVLILLIPVFLAIYVGFNTLDQFQVVRKLLPTGFMNGMVLVGSLFLIYKLVPDLPVHWRSAFVSSLLGAAGMFGVHKGFSYLTLGVFNYNKIYGSFAAIPILTLWILSLWYVILGGVALCASLQKRHIT
ncbi:YihY/virulence factor BrkB family protein [Bdellovibrio sp. ZAP7]|uniref:YihY/virulence factor BrkB family protein n=1 Tax=Bdellovibrio sp. ZAP7 TaxID=2231053 RepID=UPI001FF06ACA|nr:YihY/virulence factor BrkB family protein [Bdellovibrio sp. ZAP7]